MQVLIGFIIATFIALTGVGAGTITTPLLILFLHVPTPVAVTTGLLFSAAVKLALVPTQIWRKQVSWRVLGMMLLGGLPGVLIGAIFLRHLDAAGLKQIMNGLLGGVLVFTAIWQIAFSFRTIRQPSEQQTAKPKRHYLLALLMLPVGAEVGFSSAGAGALGTAALLSLSALSPAQVVGTDILFGFVLSLAGSGAHWSQHPAHADLLRNLILGGFGGVLLGSLAGKYIPKRPLRFALWIWLLIIGMQFLYTNITAPHDPARVIASETTTQH